MYPSLTTANNTLASIVMLAVYNTCTGIASWAKSMTALMLLAMVLLIDSLFYGESKYGPPTMHEPSYMPESLRDKDQDSAKMWVAWKAVTMGWALLNYVQNKIDKFSESTK